MRWNCPHCGTALSVENHLLNNNDWVKARCYSCKGHSLIRKPQEYSDASIGMNSSSSLFSSVFSRFRLKQKIFSLLIGLSALGILVSGTFLLLEGKRFLRKSRGVVVDTLQTTAANSLSPASVALEVQKKPALNRSPAIEIEEPPKVDRPFLVSPKFPNSKLRAGPGLEYPIVAIAHPEMVYRVRDWEHAWFKVEIVKNNEPLSAWIRNDVVVLNPK